MNRHWMSRDGAVPIAFSQLKQAGPSRLRKDFTGKATSHDREPFFLTLEAKFDPQFEISVADLPM